MPDTKNVFIFTPAKKNTIIPEKKMINAVPKSGCLKTNKTGKDKIMNGNKILCLISKLCNFIE